jgi:hypothetical protein
MQNGLKHVLCGVVMASPMTEELHCMWETWQRQGVGIAMCCLCMVLNLGPTPKVGTILEVMLGGHTQPVASGDVF